MSKRTDKKKPSPDTTGIIPLRSSSSRTTRLIRIAMIAAVVFGVSWRLANPADIAADADLYATPWAMLALLPVFALGAWTYEVTGRGEVDVKGDVIWGVLLALTAYLGLTAALTIL